MKLKDIGEFGLIDRIARGINVDKSVIRPIGDDAAVMELAKGKYLLLTTDMIVEGVHFKKGTEPFWIGCKALGTNISDIAAMGGTPRYAVVSIGLPADYPLKGIDGIYRGIRRMAHKFHINIVGGDTNRSQKKVICICLIGEVKKGNLVTRNGAKVGDIIFVTGSLGGSSKGKHLKFTPRIKESQILTKNYRINAMIDISDGLASDLGQIAKASRVGAIIYEARLPLFPQASLEQALFEGEDFELLFCLSRKEAQRLSSSKRPFKTRLSSIGEIVDREKGLSIVKRSGCSIPLKQKGFRHF